MSSQSPSVVLYSSDGTELAVVNNTDVVSEAQRAILIAGVNPNNKTDFVPSSYYGALGVSEMSNGDVVQSNATVTTSGSFTLSGAYVAAQEIALIVNVGAVIGTGSIQYTIQEVDPGDNVTTFGNSATTVVITSSNAPAVFTAVLNTTTSTAVVVTWTVVGLFSATIYSTIVTKSTPAIQVVSQGAAAALSGAWPVELTDGYGQLFGNLDNPFHITGSITATDASVGLVGFSPPIDATYVGSLVTTAMESGLTSGNMYPLNLTTTGLLRIDGAYPLATATSTAVDMMQTGGVVTVSYPVYASNTVNALSLTTIGQLRTLSDQGAPNSLANAWPVELTDGYGNLFGESNNPLYVAGSVSVSSVTGTVTVSGSVVSNQGTAASLANAWPVELTDGYGNLFGEPNNPINVTGTFNNSSVSAAGATPPSDATYMGALVTTLEESGLVSGDMYPLNLTTTGLLRVDGSNVVQPVSGTVAVSSISGSVTVSGTTTSNQGAAAALADAWPVEITDGYHVLGTTANPVVVSGFVTTNKALTSTVTSVAVTANANNALLAANAVRIAATLYNGTNKNIAVKYGTVASSSNFSFMLLPNAYMEVQNDWSGEIDAFVPTGATGAVLVTELSP